MQDLKLILPTKKYKEQILSYKKNMLEAGSTMDGCGSLRYDNFDIWLQKSKDWRKGKNLPENYVSSTQFLVIRKLDNKLVGMIQIRHSLNDFLLNYGGNIGYSVDVFERKKGYCKKFLKLGLKKCKLLGMSKVLVTCLADNIASKKCILANAGVYEDSRLLPAKNINIERYWIKI